jgi:inner membrane protein
LKNTLVAKGIALLVVIVILMIGLGMIADVVSDRQRYRTEASNSIASSYAGEQTILGPMIHSACVEYWNETTTTGIAPNIVNREEERRREFLLTAMPEVLKVQTGAAMDQRERGVHKVNTFNLKTSISAQWAQLGSLKPEATKTNSRMECGAPIMMVSVTDPRGIRTASLKLGDMDMPLKPGTFHPNYAKGLHASLPEGTRTQTTPLTANIQLELVGSESAAFVPLGSTTEVEISSSWPHPSFGGRFLPSEREVRDSGFLARWRLSSLATSAQAQAKNQDSLCAIGTDMRSDRCVDSFSVSFIDPINPYSLTDRATKYGFLFIVLTFVAVGMFEIMKRLRVHPVQYLLVGAALCSFFLLLISLSEHLPFGAAYGLAAGACVLLLGYYASHILGGLARGLPLGGGIALLYGLLYLLLQLEQTALVVGSIAMFVVLSIVMIVTRKVNWYQLSLPTVPSATRTVKTPPTPASTDMAANTVNTTTPGAPR